MNKKKVVMIMLMLLISIMVATPALTAEDIPLTAQQKFDALKEIGIFEGMAEGGAGQDDNMTRAQFAKVAALILGLDTDTAPPAASSFNDVALTHWAIEEIHAIKQAGIMVGHGDGTFKPDSNLTIEQLAKVLVETLGLGIDKEAEVAGTSTWAQGYVAAAINAGIISAGMDFTAPAGRELLVLASYTATEILNNKKQDESANGDDQDGQANQEELDERSNGLLEHLTPMPDRVNNVGDAIIIDLEGEAGSGLTYSVEGFPNFTTIRPDTGWIHVYPLHEGTYQPTVIVKDEHGNTASRTFTWTINKREIVLIPTWDVTKPTLIVNSPLEHTVGENVYATSNEAGSIYLINNYIFDNISEGTEGITHDSITAEQLNDLTRHSGFVSVTNTGGNKEELIESSNLFLWGDYVLLAVDKAGNVSLPCFIEFID